MRDAIEAIKAEIRRYEALRDAQASWVEVYNQRQAAVDRAHYGDGVLQVCLALLERGDVRGAEDAIREWQREVFEPNGTASRALWWREGGSGDVASPDSPAAAERRRLAGETFRRLIAMKEGK